MAERVRVPVIGSGDVVDRVSASAFLCGAAHEAGSEAAAQKPKLAGLLVGRHSLENPLVFRDILSPGDQKLANNQGLVLSVLDMYLELLREEHIPKRCCAKLKQLVARMCRGFSWRKEICTATSLDGQVAILNRIKAEGSLT